MIALDALAPGIATGKGEAVLAYLLPRTPAQDPRAIGTAFMYLNTIESRKWTFSALPGDITVEKTGETPETPPQDCWRATVPTVSGSTRYYFATSSDGPFVPLVSAGFTFEKRSGAGYVERLGRRDTWTVQPWLQSWPPPHIPELPVVGITPPVLGEGATFYDGDGQIERNEIGATIHEYSYEEGYVMIEANTRPRTRMRCDLDANDDVETVTLQLDRPGQGWTSIWAVAVTWSDGRISSITYSPAGVTVSFGYYDEGSMSEVHHCGGEITRFLYDEEAV